MEPERNAVRRYVQSVAIRLIECGSVPLPKNWSNFLAMPENKADLAAFLSIKLSTATYGDIDVVELMPVASWKKIRHCLYLFLSP